MNIFDNENFIKKFYLEPGLVPSFVVQDWIDKCEDGLKEGVERDFIRIRDELFLDKRPCSNGDKKLYTATAGGPCSGKSTELDYEIYEGNDPRYQNSLIADPDRYVMEYMFTYRNLLRAYDKARLGVADASKQAYDRTRPGSNIISNLLLNKAFNGGYNIIHGTTMTGGAVDSMLEKLGNKGYERRLLLCYADDETRVQAGEKRITSECHYQVDPSDFVTKGGAYPQKHGVYFNRGDDIRLMWKNAVNERAVKAAQYIGGLIIVHDEEAYAAYIRKYEADRKKLGSAGTTIPSFSDVEQVYVNRFKPSTLKV